MADAQIIITGQIFTKDMWGLIDKAFHEKAPDLRDMEVGKIVARTPVDTGGLAASVQGDVFEQGTPDLVYLYPDDQAQIDAWGRVYAPYQEGGSLGLETWTTGDHEMFGHVLDDDLMYISDWAYATAYYATSLLGDQ